MKKFNVRKFNKPSEKHKLKAVLTVELSYLFIILFSIFVIVIHTVFYYHDKNILQGAVNETAVLWAQLERRRDKYTDMSAETFCRERINGKLILFSGISVSVEQTEEEITVIVLAEKGFMKVSVQGTAMIVKPEDKIRKKKILEGWVEQEG